MIKYDDNKKECIITGEADRILNEFSVICYGLLQGGFEEDKLFIALYETIGIFREKNMKKTKKNKRRKNK